MFTRTRLNATFIPTLSVLSSTLTDILDFQVIYTEKLTVNTATKWEKLIKNIDIPIVFVGVFPSSLALIVIYLKFKWFSVTLPSPRNIRGARIHFTLHFINITTLTWIDKRI